MEKIDLKKRADLKKFGALGLGGALALILGKHVLAQEFGHTGDEILSGKIAYGIISAMNSASDATARSTTSTAYVDYPNDASPTITVSLTLTKESLVFAFATIPAVVNSAKGGRIWFSLQIDGSEVDVWVYRHVIGTYVTAGTHGATAGLHGAKVCASGSRIAKVRWKTDSGTTGYGCNASAGGGTARIYIIAIPG